MRVQIECNDIVVVLSRALDQTRRMGIGVAGISATQGNVTLTLERTSDQLSRTLGRRMESIEGVTSLAMLPCPY